MWFNKPVVCGSRAGLPWQKEAVRHLPVLCGQWFGSLPHSQMAGVSVSFLSPAILFRSLTSSLSFFLLYPLPLPLPSQMKTFPLVNSGQKSWVEDTTLSQKDISLSDCGMLMIWSKGKIKPLPINGFFFFCCLCMHVTRVSPELLEDKVSFLLECI